MTANPSMDFWNDVSHQICCPDCGGVVMYLEGGVDYFDADCPDCGASVHQGNVKVTKRE
jgi:rubredoxin